MDIFIRNWLCSWQQRVVSDAPPHRTRRVIVINSLAARLAREHVCLNHGHHCGRRRRRRRRRCQWVSGRFKSPKWNAHYARGARSQRCTIQCDAHPSGPGNQIGLEETKTPMHRDRPHELLGCFVCNEVKNAEEILNLLVMHQIVLWSWSIIIKNIYNLILTYNSFVQFIFFVSAWWCIRVYFIL